MTNNWKPLDSEEADELFEKFESSFEAYLNGSSAALESLFHMLEKFLDSESDYFLEILEDLPESTPSSFVQSVLKYESSNSDFVDEVLAALPRWLKIDNEDLLKMMEFTYLPYSGSGHPWMDSKCGRATVAINLHASEKMLLELASDESGEIRMRVALHPSITTAVAARIIESAVVGQYMDDEHYVLTGLATNHKLDPETLEILAQHDAIEVRTAVALNPGAPDVVRKQAVLNGIGEKLPSDLCSWWEYFENTSQTALPN